METEIHSPMQCVAEKMCSLCIWGQNLLLASKHVTGAFLALEQSLLVCIWSHSGLF